MSFQTIAPPAYLAEKPRIQPEGVIKYSLKNSFKLGQVYVTAPGVCEWTPSTYEEIPAGDESYHLMAVVSLPVGTSDVLLTVSGNRGGSGLVNGYVTVIALSTWDSAFLFSGGPGWNSVSNVTCAGGVAGDLIDIYAVPDPDQFTELYYVRSFEFDAGPYTTPIPDKFEPAKVHINVRREPTFSFSKDYVDLTDVSTLRGREVTLMFEMRPAGLSAVVEYIILPKAAVSVDESAPDNAMITSNATGFERRLLIYQPGV